MENQETVQAVENQVVTPIVLTLEEKRLKGYAKALKLGDDLEVINVSNTLGFFIKFERNEDGTIVKGVKPEITTSADHESHVKIITTFEVSDGSYRTISATFFKDNIDEMCDVVDDVINYNSLLTKRLSWKKVKFIKEGQPLPWDADQNATEDFFHCHRPAML